MDAQEPPTHVEGCELMLAEPDELEFRVDMSKRGIGDVLNELVAHRSIEDIAITEPPLENVISHIYHRGTAR